MNTATALMLVELIDLATVAATRGGAALASFRAHKERVEYLVRTGVAPTPVEIAALHDAVDELRVRLHRDD